MYNLSQNYELLYQLICQGNQLACYVNYESGRIIPDRPAPRDICKVWREKEFDIDFVARGISYGSVRSYDAKKGTEKEGFLRECVRMNVEFILPHEIKIGPLAIPPFFHTFKVFNWYHYLHIEGSSADRLAPNDVGPYHLYYATPDEEERRLGKSPNYYCADIGIPCGVGLTIEEAWEDFKKKNTLFKLA